MAETNDDPFAALTRYGFDRELFASWQKAVADGTLSKANNVIQDDLRAPPPKTIGQLPGATTKARAELHKLGAAAIAGSQLGVVVLNGGMATRFGGVVKGVVDVLGAGRSFLALAMQDVQLAQRRYGGKVQVFLMNSFATDAVTREHFEKHGNFGLDADQVHHFTQFVSVRMEKNGELFRTADGGVSPYGPGHGDFPAAFRGCGLLQRFLDGGGRYVLVRNVDNLGARIDADVLGHHIHSKKDVTVEVAPKWPEDAGGAPYLVGDRVELVEQLRYPPDFRHDIVDVFNSNTFTFTARALDRDFDLGWYYVEKTVEDRKAVQVEHLVGEVTRWIDANYLRVRRSGTDSRFLPVKTPDDLDAARDEIAEMYAEEAPPG
ncbi:MAG: UTP--glucose-1-phosphate uridylyltransferase [Planctomycetota bacterium]